MRDLRENVGRIVNEFIDGFVDQGSVDLQSAISLRLPVTVIGDLLGLPRELGGVLQSMAESTTKLADGTRLTPEEILAVARRVVEGANVINGGAWSGWAPTWMDFGGGITRVDQHPCPRILQIVVLFQNGRRE